MRQAPGIRIMDQPNMATDNSPAMDVPVFIGFAERGPLHRPVALDDPTQYAKVFGGNLKLAARADGRFVQAHLPAAVASFFIGGGRRCYVIRVAGDKAETARFPVAGVRLATRLRDATGHPGDWMLAAEDFQLRAASPGSWADDYALTCRVRCELTGPDSRLTAGDVLRVHHTQAAPGKTGWLPIQKTGTVLQAIAGAGANDWLWTSLQDALSSPPAVTDAGKTALPVSPPSIGVDAGTWLVERITIDLALGHPDQALIRRESCALAPGESSSNLPWFETDAQGRYDGGETLAGAEWPLAGSPAAPQQADWMLLPVLADAEFAPWEAAQSSPADVLVRNGLEAMTAGLFVDPAWLADAPPPGKALLDWADNLRYLGDAPRRLHGLHGALGFDDVIAREATWLAVPDAVHPSWAYSPLPAAGTGSLIISLDPASPPEAETDFDACVKPPTCPVAPHFNLSQWEYPAGQPWPIDIAPQGLSSPARFEFEVEAQIAPTDDFSTTTPLPVSGVAPYELPPARIALSAVYSINLPAGQYFLRARLWRKDLTEPCKHWHVSAWSQTETFLVRDDAWQVVPGPVDATTVSVVHAALRDLCASTREHFALLSVPQDWDEITLALHVAGLRSLSDRPGGAAALESYAPQASSFIALYHPWLLQRDDDGMIQAHPPEGAVLGVYARRSRNKGAWAAAGLDALDAVGLSPAPAPEFIEAAGGNAIEIRPTGIGATRAFTLAEDEDWQAVGVRRLFILLRRLARREGERYLFEPNDFSLRRSLERGFDTLLARLMHAGAFRGNKASESYLLRTASATQASAEIERGECSLEIRVAPSRPLRFLSLRVLRSGEQLLIEDRN